MGRGVSSGGGQSSLGYLFGSGEPPKPAAAGAPRSQAPPAENNGAPQKTASVTTPAPAPPAPSLDVTKQVPAGIQGNKTNNYFRADGQNSGNFLTDRPSTKVHAAPGGGSSLGYLFGGGSN